MALGMLMADKTWGMAGCRTSDLEGNMQYMSVLRGLFIMGEVQMSSTCQISMSLQTLQILLEI